MTKKSLAQIVKEELKKREVNKEQQKRSEVKRQKSNGKIHEKLEEIKKLIERQNFINSKLCEETVLMMIFKKLDVLPNDFTLVFGKENYFEIREMLLNLWKNKFLVKNDHGHYTINPDLNFVAFQKKIPQLTKEDFEAIIPQVKKKVISRNFRKFN